jgi:hypothetical protein
MDLYHEDLHEHVDEHALTHEIEILNKYQYQDDYEVQLENIVVLNHSLELSTNHRLLPSGDHDDAL